MSRRKRQNKTLELTPGVAVAKDATNRMDKSDCAVVGGAAQLYVGQPQGFLGCRIGIVSQANRVLDREPNTGYIKICTWF